MKREYIFSLALLGSLCIQSVNAENYFKPGTEWIGTMSFPYNPSDPDRKKPCVFSLKESEDPNAPGLLMESPYNQNVWIKTEGNKVYFMHQNADEEKWYLLYNFDLQPGESEIYYSAYFLGYNPEDIPYSAKIVCENINTSDTTFEGWETLQLKSYTYFDFLDEFSSLSNEKIWIKGIGSTNGPLFNFFPDVAGGTGFVLQEVRYNGKEIFKATSGITEVTEGTVPYFSIRGNNLTINSSYQGDSFIYTIDGSLITRISCDGNPVGINLPAKGMYVVKIGTQTLKIVI